jgi:Spy/CpxP family protein refolding chaperone
MARQTAWVLALVLTCTPAAGIAAEVDGQGRQDRPQPAAKDGRKDKGAPQPASARPDDRERWKWWLYDRAELGITDKQSADINQVFESVIPGLRESRQELERAEKDLARAIEGHTADVAAISLLVDRVENARSQNNKMRVLMLYRMHLLLSAEQRVKLDALRARARQERERRDREAPTVFRHRP